MKQEQNLTATEQEVETMETEGILVDDDGVVIEEEISDITLPLLRDTTKVDGKTYHYYYVKIRVFGKDMKLELRPKANDRNAYWLLDGIFGERTEVPLYCSQGSMLQEGSKKRTRYMIYTVKGVDPDTGIEFMAALTPYGDTSKRTLEALYHRKAAELN